MSGGRQRSLTDFFSRTPSSSSSPAPSGGAASSPASSLTATRRPPSATTNKNASGMAKKTSSSAGSTSKNSTFSTKVGSAARGSANSTSKLDAPKKTTLSRSGSSSSSSISRNNNSAASTSAHILKPSSSSSTNSDRSQPLVSTTNRPLLDLAPLPTPALPSISIPTNETVIVAETPSNSSPQTPIEVDKNTSFDALIELEPSPSPVVTPSSKALAAESSTASIYYSAIATSPVVEASKEVVPETEDIEMGQAGPSTNAAAIIPDDDEEDIIMQPAPTTTATPSVDISEPAELAPTASSSSSSAAPTIPSVVIATPPRRVHREAGVGATFIASPSGSPLSSLGATPSPLRLNDHPKQDGEVKKRKKRRMKFEGVEIIVKSPRRLRRERSTATADFTDLASTARASSVMGGVQEEDHDEDEPAEEEEEEEDEEDEMLAALLAKAKQRIADKAQLAPTPAAQAVVQAAAGSSGIRLPNLNSPALSRPKRTIIPTDKGRSGVDHEEDEALRAHAKDKQKFDNLVKDSKSRQAASLRMNETQALISQKCSLDSDSEDSEDDETPRPRSADPDIKNLTEDDIAKLAATAARVAAVDGSPAKRDAEAKVQQILIEEVNRTQAAAEDASPRVVWRSDVRIKSLGEKVVEEGWKGKIASAINDAVALIADFPCPIHLFSRARGVGSEDDRKEVAAWLLAFICHPSATEKSAHRASLLLSTLVDYTLSQADSSSTQAVLLAASDFGDCLIALGAKDDILGAPSSPNGMDVDPSSNHHVLDSDVVVEGEELVVVSEVARTVAVRRLLTVLIKFAGGEGRLGNASLLAASDIVSLACALVQLSLDPTAASTRGLIERTLQAVVDAIPLAGVEARCELFEELLARYLESNEQTKLEVLRALPHCSKGTKILRKWLAWAFLVDMPDSTNYSEFSQPPPIANLTPVVTNPKKGPFSDTRKKTFNTIALHRHTMILAIAVTDLHDQLQVLGATKAFQKDVEGLFQAIGFIEEPIRLEILKGDPTRNRAKNALTRLKHSLDYQWRFATGWVVAALPDDDNENGGGGSGNGGGGKKRRLNVPEAGQTRLSFAPAAPAAPAPTASTSSGASTSA